MMWIIKEVLSSVHSLSSINLFVVLFSWGIYICSLESQEVLDAELSARVLQLINVTDNGIHSQVLAQR